MNDVNSSCAGEPDPEAIPEVFENALTVIQNQTVKLACAISTVKYLLAWSEACELRRALQRADTIVGTLREPTPREHAARRLNGLCLVAFHLLDHAPNPSPLAIRQARSSDWRADRSAWDCEEEHWIANRAPRHEPELTHRAHSVTRPGSLPALLSSASRTEAAPCPPAPATGLGDLDPCPGEKRERCAGDDR